MACVLSKFILLKSSKRGKYLRYRKEDDSNHAFLQLCGDEKDEDVEIQYLKLELQKSETMEGFIHIRCCYNNKYWVRKSGDESKSSWIAAESNEAEEDQSKLSCTLFKPVLVEADVDQDGDKPQKIRLVHVDQAGQQRYVALANSDFLTLQDDVDEDNSIFMVYASSAFPNHTSQKSVISREINDVKYNLRDSRVYNVSSVVKLVNELQNTTSVEQSVVISVEYTISKTMNWSDSQLTPSNISASMYASIPYVGSDLRVKLSEERNLSVVFGKEQSESQTVSYQMNLPIPPRKKVKVSVTATRAQCDVPFSFRVTDRLSNGSVVQYIKNDGLFTGLNEFDFSTKVTQEDL